MKVLRAVLSGLVAFSAVVVMIMAGSYLRCLAEGITYNLSIAYSIAVKTGLVPGGVIFILSLIGAPRRGPPF